MFTAFISGIATALTPCTIVLIPIFLYRFGIWGEKETKINLRALLLTIFGFLISLLIIGITFHHISNSQFFNLVKLILGTTFIIIGVLQLTGNLNLNFTHPTSNSFLLGAVLPWTISFSPCVLPIFTAFLSSESSDGITYLKILSFGTGILTPAFSVALFGNKLFEVFKKGSRGLAFIERFSGLIIIGAGIYLNFQMLDIRDMDILVAGILFGLVILGLAYYVLFVKQKITISNLLIIFSITLMWFAFTYNCYNKTAHTQRITNNSSSEALICDLEKSCEACNRCAILFSVAAIIGSTGYVVMNGRRDRVLFKLPKIKLSW